MIYDNQKIIACPKCGTERVDFDPEIYLVHTLLECSKCGFSGYNFREEDRKGRKGLAFFPHWKPAKEFWKRLKVKKCEECEGSGTILNDVEEIIRVYAETGKDIGVQFLECSKCKGKGYLIDEI